MYFSFYSERKVRKEAPLKGERRLKIGEMFVGFSRLYMPILRDPLPLKDPSPFVLRERRTGVRWNVISGYC